MVGSYYDTHAAAKRCTGFRDKYHNLYPRKLRLAGQMARVLGAKEKAACKPHTLNLFLWCREGGSNPHEVALGGF
jgi:hypothetical protein